MHPFLVEKMTQAPGTCMGCGTGHVPDNDTGRVGPFVNLDIDYNWGDSGYLCFDCVGKCAVLMGWISPDTAKEQVREVSRLEKKIHDLEATVEIKRRREREALRAVRGVVTT